VIIAYDVGVNRVNHVKKFLRKYLNWIQNSLFEGELSEADLVEIKMGLKDIIDEEEDMIVVYRFRAKNTMKREVLGFEKSSMDEIL